MCPSNRETEPKPTIARGFLLGVVCVLVALLLGFGFFAAGQHSITCLAPNFGQQSSAMGAENYIAKLTGFYECIISIQFAVIGVVLAVAFVYVHTVSKQQARDMATEALDSTSFRKELEHIQKDMEAKLKQSITEQWFDFKNSGDIEEIRVNQKELSKRVKFVEQVMNAYTSSDDKTGLTLSESSAKDRD